MIHKHNNLNTKDGAFVQSTEIKTLTGNATLLFNSNGAEGG